MSQPTSFRLPIVSGRTFVNETVRLDGTRYENCEFIGCTLVYSGGPAETSKCHFHPDTMWKFEGPAATVLETLQQLGFRFEFGTGPEPEPIHFPSDAL